MLRGLVMILMALDHSRDFFHADSINGLNPLDLEKTTPALFFTRWITHFCAPVFVFLAGTSIFFMQKTRSAASLSTFLISRGLWLVLLEFTLINWGWIGNMSYHFVGLFVIWVLGLSMVLMAGLIRLPKPWLLFLGLALVFGHNAFDGFNDAATQGFPGFIWSVLHVSHLYQIDSTHHLFVGYPLLPWLGIMILGYLLGQIYDADFSREKRKKILITLGWGCLALFVALRIGNFYGDAHHWELQTTGFYTLLSFIDTSKYPPSLLYALMTLGPACLFLAFFENVKGWLIQFALVFGRVPFFYYLLHIYLIHLIAFILFFASGFQWSDLDGNALFGGFPKGFGYSLWVVYALWMLVVLLLYLPCRWYHRYKSNHKAWWLSYL